MVSSSQIFVSHVPASSPLTTLNTPNTKETYKKKVKQHAINYWEIKLRMIAEHLTSLKFFKPSYKSLDKPHPLLTSTGPFSYEVTKALFLSGLKSRTDVGENPVPVMASSKLYLVVA